MIVISIADEVSPFIKELALSKNRIFGRAMKSLGWYFRKETQKGIRSGSPGGERFTERTPYSFRRAFDKKAPKSWYGRLSSAIAYTYHDEAGELHIGWRTSTAALVGRKQEEGFARTVTEKVRAKYASLGYHIAKSVIDIPDRPFFEPMAKEMAGKIAPYVTEKVRAEISSINKGTRMRRVYKEYKS